MATFTITLDLKEFEAKIAALQRPRQPIVRALNRSIASGQILAVRLIAQDMGLKVAMVRRFVMTHEASTGSLSATLFASAKRIPLIAFGASGPEPSRGRGRGIKSKLKGGAGRYPHAFFATVGIGRHRGIFERVGTDLRKSVGAWSQNLPIRELRGPSIWQAFQKYIPEAIARTKEQLVKNIAHEIEFALSKGR